MKSKSNQDFTQKHTLVSNLGCNGLNLDVCDSVYNSADDNTLAILHGLFDFETLNFRSKLVVQTMDYSYMLFCIPVIV